MPRRSLALQRGRCLRAAGSRLLLLLLLPVAGGPQLLMILHLLQRIGQCRLIGPVTLLLLVVVSAGGARGRGGRVVSGRVIELDVIERRGQLLLLLLLLGIVRVARLLLSVVEIGGGEGGGGGRAELLGVVVLGRLELGRGRRLVVARHLQVEVREYRVVGIEEAGRLMMALLCGRGV